MITVGLPMYRSGGIAWLALESLCNQETTYDWELIVIEETDNALGLEALTEYKERLYLAGCKNIIYIPLNDWMPLSNKWVEIGKLAKYDNFMLQAADCYSQPHRIEETVKLLNLYEWVQSRKGLFYDINKEKTILFDSIKYSHPCSLNMALKTKYIKGMQLEGVRIAVDSWLMKQCLKQNKKLKVGYNDSDNWIKGLDTNGYNQLSKRGDYFDEPRNPFYKTELNADIPLHIKNKLLSLPKL